MDSTNSGRLAGIFKTYESELIDDWVAAQRALLSQKGLKQEDVRRQCGEFLRALAAIPPGASSDVAAPVWLPVRELLGEITQHRGRQGFTPTETAMFVFSLKKPVFTRLRREVSDADALAAELWAATEVFDKLGLYSTEVHQQIREEVIHRQQAELLELSTPVVKVWEGVLALPLIGTLDSGRTQTVMQNLLEKIVEYGAAIAIIDITGVPTVDTLVAQHLIKTVTAAQLMGAECIISGIRPQIAQTIVHLGVDLGDIATKASLADALALALRRTGRSVVRTAGEN